MKNRVFKNWLPIRVWLSALKLNMRGLWLRLFPRKTLQKQINWLREQNNELQTFNQMLLQQRLELEANIRKIYERLLKEQTQNAEICLQLDLQNKKLIAGNEKLQTRCSELVESVRELEREREKWVAKTQAHRDARRKICLVLNKLANEDSFLERDLKRGSSYRTPTRKDLENGPIPVEVSNDGENWSVYWLFYIGNHPNPYHCRFLNDKNAESRFFYLARVWEESVDA